MDRAYLARHLFDGERLAQRALIEFTAALRSGRMVAFVGSYATQGAGEGGYRSWSEFLKKYAENALGKVSDNDAPRVKRARVAIEAMSKTIDNANSTEDALASLSVIEYAFAYAKERVDDTPPAELSSEAAKMFKLPVGESGSPSTVKNIIHGLGIDRIITLNYDLEFEWELMSTAEEKEQAGRHRQRKFDSLCKARGAIERDHETRALTRALPNGDTIISDVFSRKRTDRLIEFAVGSPDQESHVLHLHGRATDADTMIISQRDYNKQYRRSGVARLPFERALRMLFSGNPILFVGVGMNERDVTATLEQFVSDHPNRRISPAFILWNASNSAEENNALRFRWLHRFGVLTLFDNEILDKIREEKPTPRNRGDLRILEKAILDLAQRAIEHARPPEWKKEDFRSVLGVYTENRASRCFDAWPPEKPKIFRSFPHAAVRAELANKTPITVFVADPGTGKGQLAKVLRAAWLSDDLDRRSSIVNASFAFETDAMFNLISGLSDGTPASDEKPSKSRGESMDQYLKLALSTGAGGADPDTKVLIVINGTERFFAPNGAPLSIELDALVRKLVAFFVAQQDSLPAPDGSWEPPFQVILLGTARVRRYFEALLGGSPDERLIRFASEFSKEYLRAPVDGYADFSGSVYLAAVMEAFGHCGCPFDKLTPSQQALIEQRRDSDRSGKRRAILSAYLHPDTLHAAGVESPDLCLSILSVMAFVGQPIEDAVLIHAPRLRDRLPGLRRQGWDKDKPAEALAAAESARGELVRALRDLEALGLIIRLQNFPGSPQICERFGLHRSVLAEIRDRHGVPLSDSQLSAGFNLSVFVAQPADGYSPERELHHELGNLADWLIGAYKDAPICGFHQLEDDDPGKRWKVEDGVRDKIWDIMSVKKRARAWPHVSACLRAALGLMRSYYSTSTLLTLDLGDGPPLVDEDGPLTEHADRLDRLLQAARQHALERRDAAEKLAGAHPDIKCEEWLAPPPFYADDLVWLHNERGVVKLAQGDLYEARLSFEEALRINRDRVEFEDRGQNWRRITFNQVHVDIERGSLERAESRLDQIEGALQPGLGESLAKARAEIIEQFAKCPARGAYAVNSKYSHEVVLSVALVFGYRALCLHLRGHLRGAKEYFETATAILDNIGEQRAHAAFQKFSASLYGVLGQAKASDRALRLSIASAEATRQTDVAYHARISQAWNHFSRSGGEDRAATLGKLQSALLYAEAGDMHRVRIEAGLNLARVKLDGGDYDAALEHAADAMATATRYGLSLRKISLRTLIGQILIRRGDPQSGKALLERAIKNADRINYQRAVEEAQNVFLSESQGRLTAAP